MEKLNKRGQVSGGLITGLVLGVAALVIGVIIAFVVVSTLNSAELMTGDRGAATTVLNELPGHINTTGYALAEVTVTRTGYAITAALNYTDGNAILSGNHTVNSAGIVTNATTTVWNNVSLNYTYVTLTTAEQATNKMSGNFTSGIDNISSKIPTVLLVAAIVLILGILAVLVAVWQKMRVGGTGI